MKKKLLVCLLALTATVAFARGGGGHGGGSHGSSHGSEGGHESSGWHEEGPQPLHPGHYYAGHVSNASDTDETGSAPFWHNVVIGLLAGLFALVIVTIPWR